MLETAGNGAGIVYSLAADPAMVRSIDRNPRKLHDLSPFLGLVRDQPAEFGRGHRLGDAADLGQPRHELRVLQRLIDRLVEQFDDFRRRALGRGDAVEAHRFEARHRLGNRGNIRHARPAFWRGDAERTRTVPPRACSIAEGRLSKINCTLLEMMSGKAIAEPR